MSDPAWQQGAIYLDPAGFTFPTFQELTYFNGATNTGMNICPAEMSGATYFEITIIRGGFGVAAMGVGLCSASFSGGNPRQAPSTPNCVMINESGDLYINGTYTGKGLGNVTTGSVIRGYIDGLGNVAFANTSTTNWNQTGTDATIATVVLPLGFSGPVCAYWCADGGASSPGQQVKISASVANCAYPIIAGASYLAANPVLSISAVSCQEGSAAQITWAAANANTTGGLQYSLDGGSWAACTGVVTGASGVAVGPTVSDYNIHALALRETVLFLDQTSAVSFTPHVPGSLLVQATASLPNGPRDVFPFSASDQASIVFAGVVTASQTLGISGNADISITVDAGGTSDAWTMQGMTGGGNTTITATNAGPFAVVPGIDTTTPVTGTFLVTAPGVYSYDISCNGTVATGTASLPHPLDAGFSAVVFSPGGAAFNNLFGASAASLGPSETLVLTSATCCAGGILDIGAEVFSGAPANVDIGVDGTYATAASYTLTSGTITATDGTLAVGTYTITIRDTADPTVISNSLPLVVSGESLTLTSLSGSFGTVLVADGLSNGGPPADVDISIDGGSTWVEATSFTNTGMGSVNNPFIAVGGTISTTGTLDVLVRDHAFPDCVISNGLDLVVGEESILLTVASGSLGSALSLAGTLYEAFPAALDVTLDDGSTWQDVSSYSHGAMLPAAFISSLTTSLAVGTYTIAVRDAVFTGIVSNYLTLVISAGGLVCAVPPAQPNLGRYRGAVGINWNGMTLIGDAFAGVVGQADFDSFTEYGNTMLGLITTPPLNDDRLRVFVSRFELDVESGVGATDCCGANPNWMLDWSKDGGRTFGPQQLLRSAGRIGHYLQRLRWLRLGQARQWIFRLQCTDPVRRVIIGVSVDTHSGMR